MEDRRIVNLEEMVAKLQAQGADIQTTLKLLMASITQLLANHTTSDAPALVQREAKTSATDRPKSCTVRPAVPPDFDGDRTKGTAFLNSCQTYI
jgi:hypothetical protein